MGIDRIHFTKDAEGKYRWKYVKGDGETLAQSSRGYDTLEEARDAAMQVTGIRVEFDSAFQNIRGTTLWRPEAVGANASEAIDPPVDTEPPAPEGTA